MAEKRFARLMFARKEYQPEKIYLERKVADSTVSRRVLQYWDKVPVQLINSLNEMEQDRTDGRVMLLLHQKGRFLKPCPGTPQHLCCNYMLLNIGYNCPLGCSYCYLPAYLDNPQVISIFANLGDLRQELEALAANGHPGLYRIGTGEFTDSLVFDHITNFSNEIIPLFARHKGWLLELKTKTDQIGSLLELDPEGRVVISWSLSPTAVIAREEPETTPLEGRLTAAQRCQAQGYWIGLHFDPIIYYDDWERDYEDLVRATFSRIEPARVIWISLGGLRFIPALVPKIKEMFPQSKIICGELFPGRDGKLRYLQKIRIELYTKLIALIKEFAPQAFVYLCMETPEVWSKVFGWSPQNNSHLAHLFAERYYDM